MYGPSRVSESRVGGGGGRCGREGRSGGLGKGGVAKAYNAAYGEGRAHYPSLSERRRDWLVTVWSAANVRVQHASRQMRTLRSGW